MSIELKGDTKLLGASFFVPTGADRSQTPALLHILDPTTGTRELCQLEDELAALRQSLEDCRRDGRPFVLGSHEGVFGESGNSTLDEESPAVLNSSDCDVSVIALMAEQLTFAYRAEYGIRATALRFFGSIGAEMRPNAPLARWIEAIGKGATLESTSSAPPWCFTSAEDVSRAIVAAIKCPDTDGEIIHVADSRPVPWEQWATAIQRIVGPTSGGGPEPWPLGRRTKVAKARDMIGFECSADRIRLIEEYSRRHLRES